MCRTGQPDAGSYVDRFLRLAHDDGDSSNNGLDAYRDADGIAARFHGDEHS
jgi:hypothetical protein